MTPDQLARLTLLLSMTALVASEEQELTFLQSIATPDELTAAGGQADDDDDDADDDEDDADDANDDGDDDESESGPPASAPGAKKPGLLDHARAMSMSKAGLIARNRELAEKTGRLTADLARSAAQLKAAGTKLAATETELAAVKAMLKEAKASAKTVSDELASLGVAPQDLPSSSSSDTKSTGPSSEDELRTALENAKTFEEKAALLEAWEKKRG